MRDSEQIAE